MSSEIHTFCKSCITCQTMNKSTPRHAPMVKRKIVTIPFEHMAIDLVGPLEKSKSGYRYLLNCVFIVPLRSITTSAVLDGLVEIFSKNGIPRILLSDLGALFTCKVMEELCKAGINRIVMTPYCSNSNCIVERHHGTVVPLVKTAMVSKMDWSKQVPLALNCLWSKHRFIPV